MDTNVNMISIYHHILTSFKKKKVTAIINRNSDKKISKNIYKLSYN